MLLLEQEVFIPMAGYLSFGVLASKFATGGVQWACRHGSTSSLSGACYAGDVVEGAAAEGANSQLL